MAKIGDDKQLIKLMWPYILTLYSELPLIRTPELWPPLYSDHFEKSQSMTWNAAASLIRTLFWVLRGSSLSEGSRFIAKILHALCGYYVKHGLDWGNHHKRTIFVSYVRVQIVVCGLTDLVRRTTNFNFWATGLERASWRCPDLHWFVKMCSVLPQTVSYIPGTASWTMTKI